VQDAYARKLEHADSEHFVSDIGDQIRLNGISVVRIHASGDFCSAVHIDKWA
jgi:hypothetical protein